MHFDWHVFSYIILTNIWPAILYRAQSCASQRAHDSKCLNEVYKAYMINYIFYKKFLFKPNWVKKRLILGGNILDLRLIWKLGFDSVNGKLNPFLFQRLIPSYIFLDHYLANKTFIFAEARNLINPLTWQTATGLVLPSDKLYSLMQPDENSFLSRCRLGQLKQGV